MSRRVQNEKDSGRIKSDGTAARTRPLSIQDIMSRREKKTASEAKKTKEGLEENSNGKSSHLESGRGSKSRKDLRDVPMDSSKKDNRDRPGEGSKEEDMRHMLREEHKKDNMRGKPREVSKKDNPKDRPKDSSKIDSLKAKVKVPSKDDQRDAPNKGAEKEQSSIRDNNHLVDKDKGNHNSHKLSSYTSGRVGKNKGGNHGDITARDGDATIQESQKGPGKRWIDEPVGNDRIKERSERRADGKRKSRGFDDEKSSQVDRSTLKKQDAVRLKDPKHFDRADGRKEYAKLHHEVPRSKRRRSTSRDYERERYDRSVSPSTREQRHSYRGHGHDYYAPYYSMDKSRRNHAETDRHRTSWNAGYSGGSYRRYESRLGGYSPRKRKTAPKDEQTTIKTASPIIRSPEKKSATWDQLPVAEDQSNLVTTLQSTVGQKDSSVPVNFSTSKQDLNTTIGTILTGSSLAVDSVQLTQATRPLRRLHIENLPSSATEDMLIGCLNEFLLSSSVSHIQRSKQPCFSCVINKDKRQAFVEFLTPEDATAALSFDGRSFNGSSLKIRRPKEYVELTHIAPKKPSTEIKLISNVVADSPHKIFISGISRVISSEMLMEIASSFGPLAAYRFLFNEDLGGACAFLEYIDHSITSKACAGLNGMKLGGCILTAVHVVPDPPTQVDNEASPFYGIPDSAKSLLEEPTKILQLKNVFDQEEYFLLSKSELEEILEDVRVECARFGAVKSINVVEYPGSSDSTTGDIITVSEDGSAKNEPEEYGGNVNHTDTGAECSVLNQSTCEVQDPVKLDIDSIPKGADHNELDRLRKCDAPTAGDENTDQSAEADQTDTIDADVRAVDDGTLEKGHADPLIPEICCSSPPGDGADKPGRENEQQCGTGVSESNTEKAPAVDARDSASASSTSALEAGCILVEFLRKEAACTAAHSLHGRRFGSRIVSAGYAPHDLYLQKYPR
ncbi:splicing factor U2af large subunit B [Oryza brachyantha]|uniref:RRM domain-containing protein n=1 Tax=Oryza brachyantha TaxID=4533 RepID=J3LJS7_ORYBR|nr:splicing factor U2af large subunit B [Oryza brachyantha]XP_015690813.1 splicing factor U2af large subunit B [Oryza brachyantha]